MAIYIGTQKINVSGVDKVYVGSQLVYQASVGPAILDYITISGQTTTFNLNDTFYFGGTVTAYYSNGTTADVTNSSVIDSSQVNMSVAGVYTVYVSYTEGPITQSDMYSIYVGNVIPDVTSTHTIAAIASEYSWINNTVYNAWYLDYENTPSNIYIQGFGGGNNARYFTSGTQWRFYQNSQYQDGGITITAPSGYILKEVIITYASQNNGKFFDASGVTSYASGTSIYPNSNSLTLYAMRDGSGTYNGQCRITEISVTYGE